VLVGDSGQLGSVGAGGVFAAISRERAGQAATVHRLEEVVRQITAEGKPDHAEIRALAQLRKGSPDEWMRLRDNRGQLHTHAGRDAGRDAIAHAADMYLQALETRDAKDLYLLTADNKIRQALNDLVRQELVARGEIEEGGEIGGRKFAIGERITLRQNDNNNNLANGMRATILDVDPLNETLAIVVDGEHGGITTLQHDYITGVTDEGRRFVQGGYANTIHTSQGGTVGETIIVSAAESLDRERGYVSASRARYATHLITWDGTPVEHFAEHQPTLQEREHKVREQLIDALQRSGVEPTANEQIAEASAQQTRERRAGTRDARRTTEENFLDEPAPVAKPVGEPSNTADAAHGRPQGVAQAAYKLNQFEFNTITDKLNTPALQAGARLLTVRHQRDQIVGRLKDTAERRAGAGLQQRQGLDKATRQLETDLFALERETLQLHSDHPEIEKHAAEVNTLTGRRRTLTERALPLAQQAVAEALREKPEWLTRHIGDREKAPGGILAWERAANTLARLHLSGEIDASGDLNDAGQPGLAQQLREVGTPHAARHRQFDDLGWGI
jgi:hypothetical protein